VYSGQQTHLFSRSLDTGRFPARFKVAFITPILKKASLPVDDPSSYRPISNLSIISKLFERLVAKQLTSFLEQHHLLPPYQSGFRRGFSTETATAKVLSDLLDAVDRGDTALLALLDLSAAFDTVDHDVLLERLSRSFGVSGDALERFRSYLSGRSQYVRCGGDISDVADVICGVPQGSVLGPILFILYTADLASIVAAFGLSMHQYADDSQIYGSCHTATPPSPYRSQLRFIRLPLRSGCAAIVSNLTPARRTSCGVPRPGVHPVYRPIPSTLPAPRFCLCQQFAASAFSSIPTLGPPHTFAQWSRGASPPCVNFDYFADMSATTVSGRW
jgi:hypothetical protein